MTGFALLFGLFLLTILMAALSPQKGSKADYSLNDKAIFILSLFGHGNPLSGYEFWKLYVDGHDPKLKATATFPVLHKLIQLHLLSTFTKRIDGHKRRYWRITRRGKRYLYEFFDAEDMQPNQKELTNDRPTSITQ